MIKATARYLLSLFAIVLPAMSFASLHVGVGKTDITPPVGTPSAGYRDRQGEGMQGVHDPLLATALFIDNGEKQIALCSVDHLGFTYEMVQKVIQKIHATAELSTCEIFIASSHTHAGGGAFLNIPVIGHSLAGAYSPETTQFYIDQTADAILQAYRQKSPAKIGIGYGKASNLSRYRGFWPQEVAPLDDVTVVKITHLDDRPLAVMFNFPVHPTVLKSQNRLFSADFIGYARDALQSALGNDVQPIYINGAQGDIDPVIANDQDRFDACDRLGRSLADTVKKIWDVTKTEDTLQIDTQKESYTFVPQATPFGLTLPIAAYTSEINAIVFNRSHAFVTIPGELSCLYDRSLKEMGTQMGFAHVSILGLTNDAHGYIITPESWRYKTFESRLSFGGEHYGDMLENKAKALLERLRSDRPEK